MNYFHIIFNNNNNNKKARAHIREAIIWHEEAIRQHSLCRKFTKDDYLHSLLRYHHDL